jgi:hypothetical protein
VQNSGRMQFSWNPPWGNNVPAAHRKTEHLRYISLSNKILRTKLSEPGLNGMNARVRPVRLVSHLSTFSGVNTLTLTVNFC